MEEEDLYIPPSESFIQWLINEKWKTSREIFDLVVDEFNLQDNHTILIEAGAQGKTKVIGFHPVKTRSDIKLKIDLRKRGYIFDIVRGFREKSPIITQNIDGDYTVQGLIWRDHAEKRRVKARIIELNHLLSPLHNAPPNTIQSIMKFLPGKDVLALCQISKKLNVFCNSEGGAAIFRNLILQKDKKYEKYIIPGSERTYYLKILHSLDDFWDNEDRLELLNDHGHYNLSGNSSLSESFFEKYFDDDHDQSFFHNQILFENPSISEDFVERHLNNQFWQSITTNSSISEKFLEKYYNYYQFVPIDRRNLSEAFIERHSDDMDDEDWRNLFFRNRIISEDFVERYLDRIQPSPPGASPWIAISTKPYSEDFFERHLDKVNWNRISDNESISEAFLEKHLDRVNWRFLSVNRGMSEAFFIKHKNFVKWDVLFGNPAISETFINNNLRQVDWTNRSMVHQISRNISLSEEFFESHIDRLSQYGWTSLMNNPSISEAFIERHLDELDELDVNWETLCNRKDFSEDFWERHLDRLTERCWTNLSKNSSLSPEFFERHLEHVYWNGLAGNKMTIKP